MRKMCTLTGGGVVFQYCAPQSAIYRVPIMEAGHHIVYEKKVYTKTGISISRGMHVLIPHPLINGALSLDQYKICINLGTGMPKPQHNYVHRSVHMGHAPPPPRPICYTSVCRLNTSSFTGVFLRVTHHKNRPTFYI